MSRDIRDTSKSITWTWSFTTSDVSGMAAIISAEERIAANGALHSWETAAIKSFWLCIAASVGFTVILVRIRDRKMIKRKTPNHMHI